MEELLREILAADRTILTRRDDLLAALDEKVPAELKRDYTPIKKAINLNVGEIFALDVGESAKARAREILKKSGMQSARIEFVIETFVKALKPPPKLVKKSPPKSAKPPVKTSQSTAPWMSAESKPSPQSVKPPVKSSTTTAPWMSAESKPSPQSVKPPVKSSTTTAPWMSAGTKSPPKSIKPPVKTSQSTAPWMSAETKSSPQLVKPPVKIPPPPKPQTSATESRGSKLGVICVLLGIVIFFGAGGSFYDKISGIFKSAEIENYRRAKTELSFNGLDLGIDMAQVRRELGAEDAVNVDFNGDIWYSYNLFAVVARGDKVVAFSSYDPNFKTRRGVHVGSDYSEVYSAYGEAAAVFDNALDSAWTDYTYVFRSLDEREGVLKFVVNKFSGEVGYIHIF